MTALSIVIGTTVAFNNSSSYFHIGPQSDLLVIYIIVDTYTKYTIFFSLEIFSPQALM